jgi:hypothetical protein
VDSSLGDKEELEKIYEDMGGDGEFDEFYENIQDASKEFEELGKASEKARLAEEARAKAAASNAASASSVISESEYANVSVDMGAELFSNFSEQTQEAAEAYSYNEDKDVNHEDNRELVDAYQEATGESLDEIEKKIEEGSLDYETMTRIVGASDVNEEMIDAMEKIVTGLETVTAGKTTKEKQQITNLLTNKGANITLTEMNNMKGKSVSQYMKSVGLDQRAAKEMGISFRKLEKMVEENI